MNKFMNKLMYLDVNSIEVNNNRIKADIYFCIRNKKVNSKTNYVSYKIIERKKIELNILNKDTIIILNGYKISNINNIKVVKPIDYRFACSISNDFYVYFDLAEDAYIFSYYIKKLVNELLNEK